MLGQIANYCHVIARSYIVKKSTCIDSKWQAIRQHFAFQATGAHFMDFADMKLRPEERPETLYQHLVEDNLLQEHGSVMHHGNCPDEDEEMSPTLENMIVLLWLRMIYPDLSRLEKLRYCTELRTRTLASIKPEISQALSSLIDEINSSEDVRS